MVYKKCGKELPEGTKFCPECGTETEDGTAQDTEDTEAAGGRRKKGHRGLIAVVCLVVLAALGVGAWWLFLANDGLNNPFDQGNAYRDKLDEIASHLYDEDDDDADGLANYFEDQFATDKANPDSDGDGLTDFQEVALFKYDPLAADSDGNGVMDADEDADGDTLTNIQEITGTGTNPTLSDTDFDGIGDAEEPGLGTDPIKSDTDGDLAADGWEVAHGFDPLVANDSFDVVEAAQSGDGLSSASAHVALSPEQAGTLHVYEVTSSDQLNEGMPGYIGPAYSFHVSGGFDSAQIGLSFDPALANDPGFDPAIYSVDLDNQTLEEQPTSISGGTATATVTHFSTYILLDRRYVDTGKPFGSSAPNGYEDADHDGFPNVSDPHPFAWDISDRDLALCSGIAYYDLEDCDDISALPDDEIVAIDKKFFPEDLAWYSLPKDDPGRVSADELKGWRVATWSYTSQYGQGFDAAAYLKDDNVIVAFRGTEGDLSINPTPDWANNYSSYLLGLSLQDDDAVAFLQSIVRSYGGYNIYVTGHSLGGHLAYKAIAANDYPYTEVATFNAFALSDVHDAYDLGRLSKRSTDIRAYCVANDAVSSLPLTSHPGKVITCDKDYSGGKDLIQRLNSEHWLINFFDDLEPASRATQVASSPQPEEAPSQTPEAPSQSPEAPPATSASVRITNVTPTAATTGVKTAFSVTVSYSISNGQPCVVNVGANTGDDPNTIVVYASQNINASGSVTLQFSCTPVRRADNVFIVYADITLPGSDDPLASDGYAVQLSGSSSTEEFSIVGKWKSVGDEGVGQAQPGAIIVFTENECNLYSPRDTYALYKEGNTLRLDATGLLGGTLQCQVVVVDNDHIELHTGSTVTYLQRVG